MKIIKGGISREIDVDRLQEYKDKGYAPATEQGNGDEYPPVLLPREELEELPLEQLADYARAHQVDVGRATSEKGILEKIVEAGKVFVEVEE